MLNSVQLIGRLGKDPEIKTMPSGDSVCNFSLATFLTWKDQSGKAQEKTEWHNIVTYRKIADICAQLLKKGDLVFMQGRIQSKKFTDKAGVERTQYEIVCDVMKKLAYNENIKPENAAPKVHEPEIDYSKPTVKSTLYSQDDIPF